MKVLSEWYRGLTPEQKKELENKITHNLPFMQHIKGMLDSRLAKENSRSRNRDVLEQPNFPYQAAYQLGYEKCLEDVIKLFDIK